MANKTEFDEVRTLQSDLDVEGFSPTAEEVQHIETQIDHLRPVIADFPTQILHVNLEYNSNSAEYEVRLALVLPGRTFATGDVSEEWRNSLEKSMNKMVHRIEHYKETLSGQPEHARMAAGTTMEVEPNRRIDGVQVREAIDSGNYSKFRTAMYPIEASLQDRIGRWVQRFPQIQAMIGDRFTISDVMEETFLMAFAKFDDWRPQMYFGQWVESLIDPAVKAIVRDPDGELEAISFQKSWQEHSE